jgi:sirohydrochlorin cobaltochelatase
MKSWMIFMLAAVLTTATATAAAPPASKPDGRKMIMAHDHADMTPELIAALKAAIPQYRAMTDMEIHMSMGGMGPDYQWNVSAPQLRGKVGVLVLTHGVGDSGDRVFKRAVEPVGAKYPTSIGIGMAMTHSEPLQSAVDDLTKAGAATIVLVPPMVSKHNTLYRQWEYIFGWPTASEYLAVPKVKTKAKLLMAEAFDDAPLFTQMLLDHAREISKNPAREAVMIVAHGPEDPEDNPPDLDYLNRHAAKVKTQGGFAEVQALNLQDDAFKPIRAANVRKLRKMIADAQARGYDILVVPAVIASFGLQAKLKQDLLGLKYRFQEKGLSEHSAFAKLLEQRIQETIAKNKN